MALILLIISLRHSILARMTLILAERKIKLLKEVQFIFLSEKTSMISIIKNSKSYLTSETKSCTRCFYRVKNEEILFFENA